jgi:hypothetical protein
MPSISDNELISRLLEATSMKLVPWEKGSVVDQFSAKYAGKWALTIDKSNEPDSPYVNYWLALTNAEGEEILKIFSSDEERLDELFEMARRRALKVDEALSDLLEEINAKKSHGEDVPF